MKTYVAKPKDIVKEWYLVDAKDQILGRLATRVASLLIGKGKVIYSPHIDVGDEVIVINASKVRTTGNKMKEKVYKSYSAYPGGYKETPLEKMIQKHPDEVIRHAVRGMLPKSRLGRALCKKLKVYAGTEHPHSAQKAKTIELGKEKAKER